MSKLKIALQKKGRLSDKSQDLLRACGIGFDNGTNKLKSVASNFPIEILYLRDDDIPRYVAAGIADLGIVGENEVLESQLTVTTCLKLGFAKCRLSLATPLTYPANDIADFQNTTIATSYPNILQDFLNQHAIQAKIEPISGSVEIAPNIGLADAICDLVSTGSTLQMNGLVERITLLNSEAVLIANPSIYSDNPILSELSFRISAVLAARNNKYILLNAPNEKLDAIAQLLPGMKSPSVLPLQTAGWSSLHAVVPEDDFWNIITKIKQLGAQGILVLPIEKMIV